MFIKRFAAAALAAASAATTTTLSTSFVSAETARDYHQYTTGAVYEKLTENQRKLYDRLDQAALKFITQTTDAQMNSRGEYTTDYVVYSDLSLTENEAYDVAQWFVRNNPQYYFYNSSFFTYSSTQINRGVVSITSYISCGIYAAMANGEERAEMTENLFKIVDEWVESVTDDETSTYQKEESINQLVIDKLEFNINAPYNQSVYSAVMNNQTVCAGYAGLFQMLCNAAGFDCVSVLSETHGWNLVRLSDGNWYVVDPTWNDTSNQSHYIFNTTESDAVSKDGVQNQNAHVYNSYTEVWKPDVSTGNYSVTNEDVNGTAVDIVEHTSVTTITSSSDDTDWFTKPPTSIPSMNPDREQSDDSSDTDDTSDDSADDTSDSSTDDDTSDTSSDTEKTLLERQLEVADYNGDNRINSRDVSYFLQVAAGMTPQKGSLGDVNKDGKVNSKDITEILKYIAEMPSALDNL